MLNISSNSMSLLFVCLVELYSFPHSAVFINIDFSFTFSILQHTFDWFFNILKTHKIRKTIYTLQLNTFFVQIKFLVSVYIYNWFLLQTNARFALIVDIFMLVSVMFYKCQQKSDNMCFKDMCIHRCSLLLSYKSHCNNEIHRFRVFSKVYSLQTCNDLWMKIVYFSK